MSSITIKKERIPIMIKKGMKQKDISAMFLDDTDLRCAMASNNVLLWVLYPNDIVYDCGKVSNVAFAPSIGWYADVEVSEIYGNLILYFKNPVIYFWGCCTEDGKTKVDRFIICDLSELDTNLYCKGECI